MNEDARDLWIWCLEKSIKITASYIPGIDNSAADEQSRNFHLDTEWQLNREAFLVACSVFRCTPDVDLFASRVNFHVEKYVSLFKDVDAYENDAFVVDWTVFTMPYIFPPFCLLARVLQRIKYFRINALVICPFWCTQYWWPLFLNMVNGPLLIFKPAKRLLIQPTDPKMRHRKWKTLQICAARVGACAQTQKPSSVNTTLPNLQSVSMEHILVNGLPIVRRKERIPTLTCRLMI